MKLLVQWTLANPADWEEHEITRAQDWRGLPVLPDPTDEPRNPDNQKGHVFALGCQGVILSGDHYAAEPVGEGLRIYVINDDPEDWPAGRRHVYVWTFNPLRADQRFGGQLNTNQQLQIYTEPDARELWPAELSTSGGEVVFTPWSEYVQPHRNAIRHGSQVADSLAANHNTSRSRRVWRDWAE